MAGHGMSEDEDVPSGGMHLLFTQGLWVNPYHTKDHT